MSLNDFENNLFDPGRIFDLDEGLLANQFGVSVESTREASSQWIELVPLISVPSL
jgi:hypothetical protein